MQLWSAATHPAIPLGFQKKHRTKLWQHKQWREKKSCLLCKVAQLMDNAHQAGHGHTFQDSFRIIASSWAIKLGVGQAMLTPHFISHQRHLGGSSQSRSLLPLIFNTPPTHTHNNAFKVKWQEYLQSWPCECHSQDLRPSPSSQIAVWAAMTPYWLHELLMVGVERYTITHPTSVIQISACGLRIYQKQQEDSVMMLASTQET